MSYLNYFNLHLVHFYGPVSQRSFLYNLGIDVRATVRDDGIQMFDLYEQIFV